MAQLANTFEFRELSRSDQQTVLWQKIRFVHKNYPEKFSQERLYEYPYHTWMEYVSGALPVGLHFSMFSAAINVMANDE